MSNQSGGFDYDIEVRDKFTANLEKFTAGLEGAEAAWSRLQQSMGSGGGGGGRASNAATESAKAQAAANKEMVDQLKDLEKIQQNIRKSEALSARERATQSRQRTDALLREVAAAEKEAAGNLKETASRLRGIEQVRVAQQRAISEERIARQRDQAARIQEIERVKTAQLKAIAAEKAASPQGRAASIVAGAASRAKVADVLASQGFTPDGLRQLSIFESSLLKVKNSGLAAAKSIASLAVAFFAFRAIQTVTDLVAGFANAVVDFNSKIETATLGVASLIAAVADVRDQTGKAVEPAQRLALAQVEAVKQIALLRKEALLTAASFEDLVAAFQTAVAPGLAAGLNLDQIRKFSVDVAKAALALGVQSTQLSEEVRSILAGTISIRNTKLSAIISNEEVNNAKQAGTLVNLLTTKLAAFAQASEQSANNFDVIVSNLQDAISQVIGEGSFALFEQVKVTLKEILDSLVSVNKQTGLIELNPAAVQAVSDLTSGFRVLLKEITDNKDTIKNVLGLVAISMRLAVRQIENTNAAFSKFLVLVDAATGGHFRDLIGKSGDLFGNLVGAGLAMEGLNTKAEESPIHGIFLTARKEIEATAEQISRVTRLKEALDRAKGLDRQDVLLSADSGPERRAEIEKLNALRLRTSLSDREKGLGNDDAIHARLVEINDAKLLEDELRSLTTETEKREAAEKRRLKAAAEAATAEKRNLEEIKAATDSVTEAVRRQLEAQEQILTLGQQIGNVQQRSFEAQNAVAAARASSFERQGNTGAATAERIALLLQENEATKARARAEAGSLALNEDVARSLEAQAAALDTLTATRVADLQREEEGRQKERTLAAQRMDPIFVQMEAVRQKIDETNKQAELPVTLGIQTALANLDLTPFQITVDFMTSAIQGLAQTISSSLIDAFLDPQKDIRESFGNLFKGLAQQLTQLLIQALLVKAVGGIMGAFGGGDIGAGGIAGIAKSVAQAEGGPVPHGHFAMSPAHIGARAYASGGRPSGLPASDTVPAWLTPGEWVMRLRAVQTYGIDTMAKINAGLVDPAGLRTLASGARRPTIAPPSLGLAGGGSVRPTGGVGTVVLPAVVASEATMSKIAGGGEAALLRFMREHRSSIKGILG